MKVEKWVFPQRTKKKKNREIVSQNYTIQKNHHSTDILSWRRIESCERLERWLSSSEMLPHRTWVRFPGATHPLTTTSTPIIGDPMASSDLHGLFIHGAHKLTQVCMHACTHTGLHIHKKTSLKELSEREELCETNKYFPISWGDGKAKHEALVQEMSAFPVSKRALRTAAPDAWLMTPGQTKDQWLWS